MSRSDDLAGVFGALRPGEPPFNFRQGTVVTWDFVTGQNTISVGGTVLVNVPFLSMSGALLYRPGDIVNLLKQGAAWMVMGRVADPDAGGVPAIGRNTQAVVGIEAVFGPFALTTSFVTQVTLPISCPVWAEAITVSATLKILARNSTAAADFLESRIEMPDGTGTNWTSSSIPAAVFGSVDCPKNYTQVVTPGSTVNVIGRVRSVNAGWVSSPSNAALLTAAVTFNSSAS